MMDGTIMIIVHPMEMDPLGKRKSMGKKLSNIGMAGSTFLRRNFTMNSEYVCKVIKETNEELEETVQDISEAIEKFNTEVFILITRLYQVMGSLNFVKEEFREDLNEHKK